MNMLGENIKDVLHYYFGDSDGDFNKATETIKDFIKIELSGLMFPEEFNATLTTQEMNDRINDYIDYLEANRQKGSE